MKIRYYIREMTPQDLDKVVEIEQQTFSKPWSRNDFLDSLKNEYTFYVVAEEMATKVVVGYCGYYCSFEEANIVNVAVEESARRNGVGETMLRFLIDFGRRQGITEMFLEVRVSNAPAIGLYEKLGFAIVGTRKNFYDAPVEDARIMLLHIEC